MKIDLFQTDKTVCEEMGTRLARRRVEMNLTQDQAAREAGISKRTLERIESGEDVRITSFLRLLRALKLIESLNVVVPEAVPGPMELLRNKGKARKRAGAKLPKPTKPWKWGDE